MKIFTQLLLFIAVSLLTGCEFWEIDKCLDQGGRWDYELKECDFVMVK